MEKEVKVPSGYLYLIVLFLLLGLMISGFVIYRGNPMFLLFAPFVILVGMGFFTVNPNSSKVLVLFGAYKGTVKGNGFFWANPFFTKQKISLRARNFDSERVKVNDTQALCEIIKGQVN